MQLGEFKARETQASEFAARSAEELQQTSRQLADAQRALCQEQDLRRNLTAEASEKAARLARLEGFPLCLPSSVQERMSGSQTEA